MKTVLIPTKLDKVAANLLTQKGLLAKTTAFGGMSLPMAISALMAIDDLTVGFDVPQRGLSLTFR